MAQLFSLDHIERMKLIIIFGSLVLFAALVGCETRTWPGTNYKVGILTDAPDGFYVWTTNIVSSYTCRFYEGLPPKKTFTETNRIQSSDFMPEHVVVSLPASQIPYAAQVYDVQVSGHATKEMLDLFRIIVVADHEAYLGDITRGGSSATVTLLLMSQKEADTVTAAIRKRYSLP